MSDSIQPVAGVAEAPRAQSQRASRGADRVTVTNAEAPAGSAEPEAVIASIEAIGGPIRFGSRTVEFSYDSDLNRVVVKIFSSATEPREIVRQIPAEEYLNFSARYRELLGLLFDEQF